MKPFSQASENNRQPIHAVIRTRFAGLSTILEIGAGTGQHAVFFAEQLPELFWQTSDQINYHQGINAWIDGVDLINIGRPFELDVTQKLHWSRVGQCEHEGKKLPFDGVYSANTAHIMPWTAVVALFCGVGQLLPVNGRFMLYGPFNRDGEFTSESNQRFHQSLVSQDREMGIRDDRLILKLAADNLLEMVEDVAMPTNNRILLFKRSAG